ncbi:hypothetical protein BJF78_17150 [Pseudonocardia sp. CNS-139]|nr:hypothetical protein BJF78_17150 [Pseudonocardia sp. CNS-139]
MSYCTISSPAFASTNRTADGSPVNGVQTGSPRSTAAAGATTIATTSRHTQKPGMIRTNRCHA